MKSGLIRNFRLALALGCLAFTTITSNATSAESWRDWQLVVSADGRRVDKANGAEWFYLADTAWSLPLMLNREKIDLYLGNRRDKGFSVIQTVAVMGYNTEWNAPNAYGHRPFIGGATDDGMGKNGVQPPFPFPDPRSVFSALGEKANS